MPRISPNETDNYGSGGSDFFSLPNDKDTARVRYMYESFDDIDTFAVHEIELNGKKRYINCLRTYQDPIDMCPLCAAGYPVIVKMFIQLFDVDEERIKVWDRGRTWKKVMEGLCNRYNPLVSTIFEVERSGKKGDPSTTYQNYPLQTDDTTLDDLPEKPELLGGLVLDKTAEDIEVFLETGQFPPDDYEAPPERNPVKDNSRHAGARRSSASRRDIPVNEDRSNGATLRRRQPPVSDASSNPPTRRRSVNSEEDVF